MPEPVRSELDSFPAVDNELQEQYNSIVKPPSSQPIPLRDKLPPRFGWDSEAESDSDNETDETLQGNEEVSVDSEEEFFKIVVEVSSEIGIPLQEMIPVEEPV